MDRFFFVVKKRRYLIGFLFLLAADSIYPQSTMYALTFCVAAISFSKSEDMPKSLIITLLISFALVAALILTAIATSFYFQYAFPLLFTQENYRIDSTLFNKKLISVSADLWLALFSMYNTLGGTLSKLTALSVFVAFVLAIKVLLKRKEHYSASKLAVVGIIIILSVLLFQNMLILLGIRVKSFPGGYAFYRLLFAPSATIIVVLGLI